jgi:hypothetical protein
MWVCRGRAAVRLRPTPLTQAEHYARGTEPESRQDMLVIPGTNRQVAASAKSAAPRLAQAKIRSDQLNTSERDVIADLFAVLETLVVRNELPAEAQGIYDQAVLMLARRWD